MVTAAFDEIGEPVYAQAWHLWPLGLQKDIIPVLIATQRPVTFKGFFALDCSRDTFKRVSKVIYLIGCYPLTFIIDYHFIQEL